MGPLGRTFHEAGYLTEPAMVGVSDGRKVATIDVCKKIDPRGHTVGAVYKGTGTLDEH